MPSSWCAIMSHACKLFDHIEFQTSVARPADLPRAPSGEVAIAGRSNAGKSSAINALARRAGLAHVSKTPGRTQLINFFRMGGGAFLVDLPGYGYARVPAAVRERWAGLAGDYLQTRSSLAGLVVVMDVRHPLTPLDRRLIEWFAPRGKPIHLLLTKADKLSQAAAQRQLHCVSRALGTLQHCGLQLFSSVSGRGVEEARRAIAAMLTHRGQGAAAAQVEPSRSAGRAAQPGD